MSIRFVTTVAVALALVACGSDAKKPAASPTTAVAPSAIASRPGSPAPDAAATGLARATDAAQAAAATSPSSAASSPGSTAVFTSGVAAGDVTPTSAVLWTRAEGGDTVAADIGADAQFSAARTMLSATSNARDFTVKLRADGLDAETRYYYRFRAGAATSATGTFVTAPDASVARPLRFVFTGDSDGSRRPDGNPPYNNFEVLDAAAAEDPAFFLYFGDTIYADRPPKATMLDGYRGKYKENRGYPALANILAKTSTYNTWDDHEVVNDFAGTTENAAMLASGRQAFREYLPIDDSAGEAAPMYRSFRWGSAVELIALDERTYRDAEVVDACGADPLPGAAAPGVPDSVHGGRGLLGLSADPPPGCLAALADPSRTMLGAAQKQYLKDRLSSSTATWKVIVNEVPMQQILALPYDRWEGYAVERRELLTFIRDSGIKNVVFLTTDLHANIFGPVRIDLFADPQPVAYEAIVGPIATATLKKEIATDISETAANLFAPLLSSVIKVDCAQIDTYAYGSVDIDPAAGTMTIAAKDAAGSVLCQAVLHAQ